MNTLDLYNDDIYKETIINAICSGVPDNYRVELEKLIDYIIIEKDLSDENLQIFLHQEDSDLVVDLILPAVRRLFGKLYINKPPIFESVLQYKSEGQYELFLLYFDIDEFFDYFIDMVSKSKNLLKDFEYMDKSVETITLIVDNYICHLLKRLNDCSDINSEIIRLKSVKSRNNNINNLLK